MAILKKIDSNVTGLRFAEEASLGVLPGTPVWVPLEPNTYEDFGGEITTVARNPINDGRQRQKGVVTDLDASGGFNSDFTQSNIQELLQGFFFASLRRKTEFGGTSEITLVDGANEQYEAASGLDAFVVGELVHASEFINAANNGLKEVTVSTATELTVAEDLVAETPPAAAKLVQVGHQFGTTEISVDVTGSLPKLINAAVAAIGVYTLSANVANLDDVTIDTKVYTFQTVLTDTDGNVLIGATASDSLDNLIAAITLGAGAGTLYATSTTLHPTVTAAAGAGDTMDATAKIAGTVGNSIVTTENGVNSSWGGGTLSGGTGVSFATLGIIPGEWIFIGGDLTAEKFDTAADNGFARVKTVADLSLELDKTQATMLIEAGTGKTIRIFVGRVLKNEATPALQVRRSYNLERTLGAPDDALPSQIQSEYLVGAVPGQATFNFASNDKLNVDLSFVATDNEQRTAATGLKAGTRPALVSEDAFNSTSDFSRLKMSILDPVDSNPSKLFAFLTEFTIDLNNNLTPNKAVSVLGAFEVTAGQFNIEGTATAYFSEVAAIAAVRNNDDITLDAALVRGVSGAKTGVVFDVPLIALGDGRLDVEQDAAITLPLNIPAAADRVFNHTMLMMFFDNLPDAADTA